MLSQIISDFSSSHGSHVLNGICVAGFDNACLSRTHLTDKPHHANYYYKRCHSWHVKRSKPVVQDDRWQQCRPVISCEMCGDVAKATKAALRDYGGEILVGSIPTRAAASAAILAFVSGFLPICCRGTCLNCCTWFTRRLTNNYLAAAPKQAATFNNTVVAFGSYVKKCDPNNVQTEKIESAFYCRDWSNYCLVIITKLKWKIHEVTYWCYQEPFDHMENNK